MQYPVSRYKSYFKRSMNLNGLRLHSMHLGNLQIKLFKNGFYAPIDRLIHSFVLISFQLNKMIASLLTAPSTKYNENDGNVTFTMTTCRTHEKHN